MRKIQVLILFLLLSLLLTPFVYARIETPQTDATIWSSAYNNIIKPIFFNFGQRQDADTIVFFKVAFSMLLFALLYGISTLVLHEFPQNSRIAITAIVSIISVILIPDQILMSVAQTYGVVFFAVLLGVPIAGGGYLIFSRFHEKTRANYLFKGLVAFVLYILLMQFSGLEFGFNPAGKAVNAFFTSGTTKINYSVFGVPILGVVLGEIAQVSRFIAGIMMFLALWWIFGRAIIGIGTTSQSAATASHSFGRSWWQRGPLTPGGTRATQELRGPPLTLVRAILAAASGHLLPTIQAEMANIHIVTNAVSNAATSLATDIAGVTDPTRQGRLATLLTNVTNVEPNINNHIGGLQRHVAIVAGAGAAATPAQWASVQAHAAALQNDFNILIRHVEVLSRAIATP